MGVNLKKSLEKLLPIFQEVAPMATLEDAESRIRIFLPNCVVTIHVAPSTTIEGLASNIVSEKEWVLVSFLIAVTGKIKNKQWEPIRDFVAGGSGTEYRVYTDNDELFSMQMTCRLSGRAALEIPGLAQEIFVEMSDYAEKVSRDIQRHLSILSPAETIRRAQQSK